MGETPSARRRKGRNAYYRHGNTDDHNPYLHSKVWGADMKVTDWNAGWYEAKQEEDTRGYCCHGEAWSDCKECVY